MTITFTVSVDDVLAFNRFVFRQTPQGRRANFNQQFVTPAIFAAVICVIALYGGGASSFVIAIVTLLLAIVYAVVYPLMRRVGIRQNFVQQHGGKETCEQAIEITPSALVAIAPNGRSEIFWTSIREIAQTPEHIFFFYSPLCAVVMPNRAFGSTEQRSELVRQANYYLALAKQPAA